MDFLKFLFSLNLKLDFEYAPVAQLVEQWPLKPLVGGSSPSGCTRRENQVSLIETLGKCRGFSRFIFYHFYSLLIKSGTHL